MRVAAGFGLQGLAFSTFSGLAFVGSTTLTPPAAAASGADMVGRGGREGTG
jgi:hypothetical protein